MFCSLQPLKMEATLTSRMLATLPTSTGYKDSRTDNINNDFFSPYVKFYVSVVFRKILFFNAWCEIVKWAHRNHILWPVTGHFVGWGTLFNVLSFLQLSALWCHGPIFIVITMLPSFTPLSRFPGHNLPASIPNKVRIIYIIYYIIIIIYYSGYFCPFLTVDCSNVFF